MNQENDAVYLQIPSVTKLLSNNYTPNIWHTYLSSKCLTFHLTNIYFVMWLKTEA